MVIGSPRNKWNKKMVNKTPTGRQMPTKNWRFNYWTKLLDGYSPKIELRFSASLRFAVFLQIRKSDKFIANIRNSKTYLPSPSRRTVETLLNAAPEKFRWASHFGQSSGCTIFCWLSKVKSSIMFTHKRKRYQNSLVDSIPSKSTSARSVAFLVSWECMW